MSRTSDIVIVGGGIIGCSLAEALANEGLQVTLVERGLLGREASWAAAGMLTPQSKADGPGPFMDFCLASRRLYPSLIERVRDRTAIDPQYRDDGMLHAAFEEREESALTERAAWQRELGLPAEVLDREALLERVPNISPSVRMAVHFGEDHELDPRLMTRGFAVAARQLGVRLMEYSPVLSLLQDGERVIGVELPQENIFARWTILAGGAWSGLVAGRLATVPVHPVKGHMLLLQLMTPAFDHMLRRRSTYLVPRRDGRIVVGATEESKAGFDKTVQAAPISKLIQGAYGLVPLLGRAELVDSWAGLRPGTPDRRPIVGSGGCEGLLISSGHGGDGILLAPLSAQLLSRFIVTDRLPEQLEPFSLDRFSGHEAPLAEAEL